ncbi:methyltransferase domain-containing protein, partial [Candidatus Kaiserbacteria bacterium]|nr:methyltransferase domain-containing protein [Candidatus Kaiserbacteria bacterium]
MTGQWAARALAQSVAVRAGETILEIGPGKGALTRELLKTDARVVAIEKDPALVRTLHERFRKPVIEGKLTIVEQDIRDFDPRSSTLSARSYVVAANIPYY